MSTKICTGPAVAMVNTIMRYQMLHDDLGNYLIIDTWTNELLAKVTTLSLGARTCQNLNKRLGSETYFKQFYQKVLTN
jgi:hypothetical protein|tara:strand:+ start:141 stop:374 length:234 start_codon:yes stop_codon:yes gene_type:complete